MAGNVLKEEVLVMKVLANPHRIRILRVIQEANVDLCVRQIAEAVGISQSLTSHLLSYLSARKVVEGQRIGQTICYTPAQTPFAKKVFAVLRLLNQ